jgi:hypothetical protein
VHEPREVGDTLYRYEEAVGVRRQAEMALLNWRSRHPMEKCVAMEGYDLGTSTRAYRLPTISQARHHRRRSGHYRHIWDIVDT